MGCAVISVALKTEYYPSLTNALAMLQVVIMKLFVDFSSAAIRDFIMIDQQLINLKLFFIKHFLLIFIYDIPTDDDDTYNHMS